jgi:hypothetical protein
LANDAVELAPPARGRYRYAPKVVIEVDGTVLQPHRMVQPPWDIYQFVAQRFKKMQPLGKCPTKLVEPILGAAVAGVEDRDLESMGVHVRRFAVEQKGVHSVQALH